MSIHFTQKSVYHNIIFLEGAFHHNLLKKANNTALQSEMNNLFKSIVDQLNATLTAFTRHTCDELTALKMQISNMVRSTVLSTYL